MVACMGVVRARGARGVAGGAQRACGAALCNAVLCVCMGARARARARWRGMMCRGDVQRRRELWRYVHGAAHVHAAGGV